MSAAHPRNLINLMSQHYALVVAHDAYSPVAERRKVNQVKRARRHRVTNVNHVYKVNTGLKSLLICFHAAII